MGDGNRPRLKRGIFGYTSGSVRRMLADREGMFAMSQQRLKESHAVVAQLQTQLQVLQQHVSQRDAEVGKAAVRIAQLESDLERARTRLEEMDEELGQARARLQEADGVALELTAARERLRSLQLEDGQRAEQVRMAESRVASLETQLVGVRAGLEKRARDAELRADRLEAQLVAAQRDLRESLDRPAGPEPDTSEHVSRILETAERAATRIIELAGTTQREHLEQLDRVREDLREEGRRIASWRDQVEPMVSSIRSSMDTARSRIDDVPNRIREALAPLGEAIESVNDQLGGLLERATDRASGGEPASEAPTADLDTTEEPATGTSPDGSPTRDGSAPVHPLPLREEEHGSDPSSEEPSGRWRQQ